MRLTAKLRREKKKKTMSRMTKEEILRIPPLKREGKTDKEVADELGKSLRTVCYWIKRLREEGHDVPKIKPKGRKKIDLSV